MYLMHGDCLEIMNDLPAASVDLCLTDPPYGTTECKWDSVIPFEPMWKELKRIVKPNGAICLFGKDLFSASLMLSNTEMFRYQLIWKKSKVGRFAQAKLRFLDTHEEINVFSQGKCSANSILKMKYRPQGLKEFGKTVKDTSHKNGHREGRQQLPDYFQEYTGYPKSVLDFKSASKTRHPTEKPVPLLEYLVSSFTDKGDTVLDFAMGSGSTGESCANLNRKFIGIEKDAEYFKIASDRLNKP
jgi:site-specific DNA-methyltransferase (adenine-specific)